MPNAIITGASRGLGLALARSLAADGWRLVIDARGAKELAPRRRVPRRADRGRRDARRRRRRLAPARPRRRRRAIDRPRSSTTPPCSGRARSPQLAELSARRAAPRLRGQRARPARARPGGAAEPRTRRPGPQHHLRRRRRGVSGLGRLRLLEGRARAARRGARRRAPGAARLHGRPRRHAHPHAPGGVPRRGHLRPPAAGGERARPARADRRRRSERPLPGGGPGPGAARERSSPSPCRPSSRRTSRRRRAGSRATRSG